jgi:diadenosine tetraphosphate (Ap4A) HIT family hydrolase
MKEADCRYCANADEMDIAVRAAELEVSNLYLTRDQAYKGRCILSLKDHKTEIFQLDKQEQEAFGRDLSRAAKAIWETFSPDKLNYMIMGDLYPHVHLHLVPKYKGGKNWGGPFEMTLSEKDVLSQAELAGIAQDIKRHL